MQEAKKPKVEHSAKNALFCCEKRGYSQAFLQNFANFIMGQLLAAASSDVGGIRDGTEIGISGNAKLGKGSQQTDFLNKRGQRVDTGSRGLLVAALGHNAPDVLRPAGEPRRARFVDVAVQDRVDDRQPAPWLQSV